MSENKELDQDRLEKVQGGGLGDGGTRDTFNRTVPTGGGGSDEEDPRAGEGGRELPPLEK
jgi:hypothetical protein